MKKMFKSFVIATLLLVACGSVIASLEGCANCHITDSYNAGGDSVKVCLVCDSVANKLNGTHYFKLKK